MCDCNQDERSVTRLQNRALRTVNRLLRRRQEQIQAETDKVVAALFEVPTEAETALRELWERAGLSCSPEDYPQIVEDVIAALGTSINPVQV